MGQYVEARGWMVTAGGGYGPRSYRAHVPHPLSGWDPVLSEADHEAATGADRALRAISSLPLSDMGTAIARWMAARDESIRSSLIEGVGSTETGLAWARYMDATGRAVSDQNDALTLGAAKQVASAVALGAEMRSGRDCDLDDILDVHNSLFAGTRDRSLGGVLRNEPMWVGPPGCLVDEATFVAPPQDDVRELMDDLVAYLNASTHPACPQGSCGSCAVRDDPSVRGRQWADGAGDHPHGPERGGPGPWHRADQHHAQQRPPRLLCSAQCHAVHRVRPGRHRCSLGGPSPVAEALQQRLRGGGTAGGETCSSRGGNRREVAGRGPIPGWISRRRPSVGVALDADPGRRHGRRTAADCAEGRTAGTGIP